MIIVIFRRLVNFQLKYMHKFKLPSSVRYKRSGRKARGCGSPRRKVVAFVILRSKPTRTRDHPVTEMDFELYQMETVEEIW
jgi:hypothetical protein